MENKLAQLKDIEAKMEMLQHFVFDEDYFPCFSTFIIIIPIDCKITFFSLYLSMWVIAMHMAFHNSE